MRVLAVAEKPTEKTGQAGDKRVGKWLTVRLYLDDGEMLSRLADLENSTIADVFRSRFAEHIRKEVIAATKAQIKKWETGK